jgi:polyribonucleotide nucleotidyltransferase
MNEVQIFSTVYSADNEHNPDVMSINAASAALHISKVPFLRPVGAVRVGLLDGQLSVNPKMLDMGASLLELVIAGTEDAIVMVEGSGREISEENLLAALEFGHTHIRGICRGIEELRTRVGVEKMRVESTKPEQEVVADMEALALDGLRTALSTTLKRSREEAIEALETEVKAKLAEKYGAELFAQRRLAIKDTFEQTVRRLAREQTLKTGRRLDGRAPDDIRPITIEVGVLPRAHGSCLFTRGETQALVSTTLGTSRDEQRMDELTGEEFKRFMLHYNFPPWSVGEVRRISGPGRREMGHGNLAERAIEDMLPLDEDSDFPYTIRVVSDITESNGSSSMATVCGGALSLMDAGVPLRTPIAGIAMGLVKDGEGVCILSDILGAEDRLGDMDFKICGTRKGITAFQMDIKTTGISSELLKKALEQARAGRLFVLDRMEECLAAPRPDISKYAPRILTIKIDVDKIREVIGPGGKMVREIQAQTGADINIEDDGTITVAAVDVKCAEAAIEMIKAITTPLEIGQLYKGTVTRIMSFGAFVGLPGNKEGMVHISELAPERVQEVTDVLNVGDAVTVKVIELDKLGRINLSKVEADRDLGLAPPGDPEQRPRSPRPSHDRPPRDRDHRSRPRGAGDRAGSGRTQDRRRRPGG